MYANPFFEKSPGESCAHNDKNMHESTVQDEKMHRDLYDVHETLPTHECLLERDTVACVIRVICDPKTDVSIHDNIILKWACKNNHVDVLESLLSRLEGGDYLIDLGVDSTYPVRVAAENGFTAIMKRLLDFISKHTGRKFLQNVDIGARNNYAVRMSYQNKHYTTWNLLKGSYVINKILQCRFERRDIEYGNKYIDKKYEYKSVAIHVRRCKSDYLNDNDHIPPFCYYDMILGMDGVRNIGITMTDGWVHVGWSKCEIIDKLSCVMLFRRPLGTLNGTVSLKTKNKLLTKQEKGYFIYKTSHV